MIDPNWNASGMTIRQEIAARIYAQAIGGYATSGNVEDFKYTILATEVVKAADALILELNKEPT